MTTAARNVINKGYIDHSMDYVTYRKLINDLLADNKVTGPKQTESLLKYTKLNVQRMQRIDKTVKLLPETQAIITSLERPQTWLVLTEGWCGDAAQTLPVMNAMALLNPAISLRMILRDEHPELMDQYLTGPNKSRSIPKLIVMDSETGQELFNWGPRPTVLQQQFLSMKAEGINSDTIVTELHSWYAKDKTVTTQREISGLVKAAMAQ